MEADLCRRLRWKGLFVDAEPDETVPDASDGYCWCARSMTCLGPDGAVAERQACVPGRRCWESP